MAVDIEQLYKINRIMQHSAKTTQRNYPKENFKFQILIVHLVRCFGVDNEYHYCELTTSWISGSESVSSVFDERNGSTSP